MNFRKWILVATLASLSGCASRSGGSDSETHFVCSVDDECRTKLGEGYGCVASTCEKVVSDVRNSCDGATCVVAFPDAAADSPGFLTPEPRPRLDGSQCTQITYAGERIAHSVYVLLDESLGMSEAIPGKTETWWEAAAGGVEDFVRSAIAPPLAIQYFPLGSAPASCEARYDQPGVDFSPLANNQAIITSLRARTPDGLSSPGPALKGGIDHLRALSAGRGPELWSVVLIAKGAPAECDPMTMTEMAALAAAGAAASPSVHTFVIALGAGASFDEVAAAGGTNQAISITGGDVFQQVRDAFDTVLGFGGMPGCDMSLPPSGLGVETFDPSLLKVYYEVAPGVSMMITRVAGASECAGLHRDGWYFDVPSAPTKVVFCPDLCAHPPGYDRGILYGCP